jgi:hypothetical protein
MEHVTRDATSSRRETVEIGELGGNEKVVFPRGWNLRGSGRAFNTNSLPYS